ncbi:MAG: hypothetical protein HYX40_11670 [Sphingobacteriales bacterium]|nr:hypothetical protein [Sphingobacteriales bacterium]
MYRLIALLLLFVSAKTHSQHTSLLIKKRNKTVNSYWIGSMISFQAKDKNWQKGTITKINKDSFYIKPVYVRYGLLATDTVTFNTMGFAVSDVYAIPNSGVQIDFIDGKFQITRTGGHMHFYWIKSGWLFRTAGLGFAALNVANGIIILICLNNSDYISLSNQQ